MYSNENPKAKGKEAMHEFSICRSMLAQVNDVAKAHQADGISSVTVGIGPLSGIEPKLLQQAFAIARSGTQAAHATLHVQPLPLRVRCRTCDIESDATSNDLTCRACHSNNTRVISGDELLLLRVELEESLHV
jgi:hydrogenase nickel incorporation protein HypA/HybF